MDLATWMLPAGFLCFVVMASGWFVGINLEKSPLMLITIILSFVWLAVYFY